MAKKEREIMEILESYDLTRCAWSAARLVGCDHKTVQRYVDLRDAGRDPFDSERRPRLIDAYAEKVEELVELAGQGAGKRGPRALERDGLRRQRAEHPAGGG